LNTATPIKVALTGDVALELIASYFRDAGYAVMPSDVSPEVFQPDFIYDVTSHDAVLSEEVPLFRDARLNQLAGCPYSVDGIRAIVDEFSWLVAASSSPAKVLAVDADNTLWKGIVSEDGPKALVPCTAFQEGLKQLADEGVLLVLLSKNDEEALPPLRCDFVVRKVNWAPKAGNLLEACRALNLGREAVVFVDDNPYERAQMKAHLPEVNVAPWTGWTFDAQGEAPIWAQRQLIRRLREYFFTEAGRTEEDRLRVSDYRAATARVDAAKHFASHADYLDDLALWVKPSRATEADLDRLAQMAGKTNQFNATTIRRTREAFSALLRSPCHQIFVFRAGDRFGEQGIVCYIVVETDKCRITDFVMSCRAMGRTLEQFALAYVTRALGSRPAIDFVPTEKNRPFAEFLTSLSKGCVTHFKEVR